MDNDVTTKTKNNSNKGNKIKAQCIKCGPEKNHIVLQSVELNHCIDPRGVDLVESYQIIQCQGCDTVSFRHWSLFSEDYEGPDEDVSDTLLYPKRSEEMRDIKRFFYAPPNVRRIYRETIDCFNNDSYILCAAGLRAIIEGICTDQKIKKGNLKEKIAKLSELGILTRANAATLHEHRYLGNDAVHELSIPSTTELTLAIEIMEHMIETIYVMPHKAKMLNQQRLQHLCKNEKIGRDGDG